MKRIFTLKELLKLNNRDFVQYRYRNMYIDCLEKNHLYDVHSYGSLVGTIRISKWTDSIDFIYTEGIENSWRHNARMSGGNGATTSKQITMLINELEITKCKVQSETYRILTTIRYE